MATKKRVKRFAEAGFVDQDLADQEATASMRGIPAQTDEEAANEAEMMSSMAMRKRAMAEGDRDEKAMPKQDFMSSKEPEAPVMRKAAMSKPAVFSNEGRSSKAPAYSNEGRGATSKSETLNERRGRRATEFKELTTRMAPTSNQGRDSTPKKPDALDERRSRRAAEFKEILTRKAPSAAKPKFKASEGYANGGSASSRADGIASKGKTRGKIC